MRPSLFEFAGGEAAFVDLAVAHHRRCLADPELNHPFSHPDQHPAHVQRLAAYWAEVLGGPPTFSTSCSDQSAMLRMHAGNGDISDLGRRFTQCFVLAADDAGLPADPEFRAALRGYMEWAVDQVLAHPDDDTTVPAGLRMPRWSWDGLQTDPAPSRDAQASGGAELRPTLHVLVGLPAAGKTTYARALEDDARALRLTPDEWMLPLFGEPDAGGRRDVLEGRFVWLALRALSLGVSVIADFGVWGRDERSALRWLAADAGADCRLVYLPVEEEAQQRRLAARPTGRTSSTVRVDAAALRRARSRFEVPDDGELSSAPLDAPPPGHPTWRSWAAQRWPTSTG